LDSLFTGREAAGKNVCLREAFDSGLDQAIWWCGLMARETTAPIN